MNGFLIGISDGHYILRRAELMTSPLEVEPLDGTIEIPARRVEFVQVLGPDE